MSSSRQNLRSVPKNEASENPNFQPKPMDQKKVYGLMAKARALEERLIKMSKSDDGFFWIGGPGEEAFNIPLGLLVKKGEGLDYDYLHLHYRSSGILIAMGMPVIDAIRQMANKATDPFSGGRNFVNHYAKKDWNIVPASPCIEVQYSIAPGTARAQKRHGGTGITIVNGGDAGTAEGDFATCLNWSSRPGEELPILILVMNNRYGISTPFDEVQGARVIAKRAEPFGIRWGTCNGNDPLESWNKIQEVMHYIRTERRPFCLEVYVSRLHGHSSSSGASRVDNEVDCLIEFEKSLIQENIYTQKECDQIKKEAAEECLEALKKVREEPFPDPGSIYDHTFAE